MYFINIQWLKNIVIYLKKTQYGIKCKLYQQGNVLQENVASQLLGLLKTVSIKEIKRGNNWNVVSRQAELKIMANTQHILQSYKILYLKLCQVHICMYACSTCVCVWCDSDGGEGHRKTCRPRKHAKVFFNVHSSWETDNTPIISPISKDKETNPTQNFRITSLMSNLHICSQMPTYHKPRYCDRHLSTGK